MLSIQTKLASGLLLSLIVTFLGLWFLVSYNAKYLAEDYIASRLQHDSETLLRTVSFDENNKLGFDSSRMGLVYSQPFSGHYYIIDAEGQQLHSRSLWDYRLNHEVVPSGEHRRSIQAGPEQQSLLVLSSGYVKQGVPLTILIAEDINPINNNIRQFNLWFGLLAMGLLIVLVLMQIFILRSSLKPLHQTRSDLKSLQGGQLDKLDTHAPKELSPLIHEINHLLTILDQRQRRSRHALSDLAHALKKPLTVIQLLANHQETPDTVKDVLQKQTDDIYLLTDRILKRARLVGHHHSGTLFSFTHDLPDLIHTLDSIYPHKNIYLSHHIPPDVTCFVDREDMLELLGNLLDNAYKWAKKTIIIRVESQGELKIIIEDDGVGADPGQLSALSVRGIRLDEETQGHGFGLAIARDMLSEYGGKISFHRSEQLGGFKVVAVFPWRKQF